jgi:hypothetical protein
MFNAANFIPQSGVLSTGILRKGTRYPDYYEIVWPHHLPEGDLNVTIFGPNAFLDAMDSVTTFCLDFMKKVFCINELIPGPGGDFSASPLASPSPSTHFIPPFPTPSPSPSPSPHPLPTSIPTPPKVPSPHIPSADLISLEFVLKTANRDLNFVRWMYYIHYDSLNEDSPSFYVDLWLCDKFANNPVIFFFLQYGFYLPELSLPPSFQSIL